MPILRDENALFLHITKTGGTSIERILKIPKDDLWYGPVVKGVSLVHGAQHMTLKELIDNSVINEKDAEELFKFTFVRNPFDRLVSLWHWKGKNQKMTLSQFLDRIEKYEDESVHRHPKSLQCHYTHDPQGRQIVDFIGRFENLQIDFDKVCDQIGRKRVTLPHVFKTNHDHYSKYFDDALKARVFKMFERDFEILEYEF